MLIYYMFTVFVKILVTVVAGILVVIGIGGIWMDEDLSAIGGIFFVLVGVAVLARLYL